MKPIAASRWVLPVLTLVVAFPALADHTGHSNPSHARMSDAEMREAVNTWYATHPRIGSQGTTGVPGIPDRELGADVIVQVGGIQFDADGNINTQIDTVKIMVGQTVRWQWNNGFHTLTSGEGSLDPNMGLIFDQSLDFEHTSFEFTFTTAEVVHYFCQPHEDLDMKGIVVVSEPVGVPPAPAEAIIGFVAAPWPNPTPAGLQFRFRLAEPGHVRADIVDARGRHVATVIERAYEAGTFGAAWTGIGTAGRVPAGRYYLRLRVPGFVGSRSFAITR